MTDDTTPLPADVQEEVDKIVTTTKRGFDLKARLKNRGLRRGSITLYLDEELGAKLGWAYDRETTDALGLTKTVREREGVVGKLDAAQSELEALLNGEKTEESEERRVELAALIPELEAERDKLIEEMNKEALVIHARAVPPVIQRDLRRLAKQVLGIEEKGIPEDKIEDFNIAHTAQLMSKMVQSITDNSTGEVNHDFTYEDAIDLMDYLPKGQFDRLDNLLGKLQFTDSISREIEGQEDFS